MKVLLGGINDSIAIITMSVAMHWKHGTILFPKQLVTLQCQKLLCGCGVTDSIGVNNSFVAGYCHLPFGFNNIGQKRIIVAIEGC